MKTLIFTIFSLFQIAFADSVVVYGKDFSFSMKVPNGWTCLCDGKAAAEIGANAIVAPVNEDWKKAKAIIFLRVNAAVDDNVKEDAKADTTGYLKQYPESKARPLKVNHSKYKTAAVLFETPQKAYEYVTYIAPKPFPKMNISVAMNVQKEKATETQMKAYKDVIASLTWLGQAQKK